MTLFTSRILEKKSKKQKQKAKEAREEVAFFQAVKAVIQKVSRAQSTGEDKNAVIKQIIDNAVISDGVEDIFKMQNLLFKEGFS